MSKPKGLDTRPVTKTLQNLVANGFTPYDLNPVGFVHVPDAR